MLGADLVLDMTIADDFALLESQREFVQRYRAVEEGDHTSKSLPMFASSCPGKNEQFVYYDSVPHPSSYNGTLDEEFAVLLLFQKN
jgi:hypothetical protein